MFALQSLQALPSLVCPIINNETIVFFFIQSYVINNNNVVFFHRSVLFGEGYMKGVTSPKIKVGDLLKSDQIFRSHNRVFGGCLKNKEVCLLIG